LGVSAIARRKASAKWLRAVEHDQRQCRRHPLDKIWGIPIMSKAITKKVALLEEATEMFNETGCVPGIDGQEVPAERIVPDAKEYISETIDDPEVIYDPKIWDTPGFTLVLSWLAQKWQRRCSKLAPRSRKNPEQLTKEQQKACLDSAAAELIREITQRPPLH
jgi:hypothetical protein